MPQPKAAMHWGRADPPSRLGAALAAPGVREGSEESEEETIPPPGHGRSAGHRVLSLRACGTNRGRESLPCPAAARPPSPAARRTRQDQWRMETSERQRRESGRRSQDERANQSEWGMRRERWRGRRDEGRAGRWISMPPCLVPFTVKTQRQGGAIRKGNHRVSVWPDT